MHTSHCDIDRCGSRWHPRNDWSKPGLRYCKGTRYRTGRRDTQGLGTGSRQSTHLNRTDYDLSHHLLKRGCKHTQLCKQNWRRYQSDTVSSRCILPRCNGESLTLQPEGKHRHTSNYGTLSWDSQCPADMIRRYTNTWIGQVHLHLHKRLCRLHYCCRRDLWLAIQCFQLQCLRHYWCHHLCFRRHWRRHHFALQSFSKIN